MSKKTKTSPPKRSSLLLIAVVLLGSAAIRTVHSGDGLTAFAADAMINEEASEVEASADEDIAPQVKRILLLLNDIKERTAMLDKREADLTQRGNELEMAKEDIRKGLAALEAAEKSLRATMALASTAAENDLARLTAVYENMKPKEAAALFEEMDPEFAAGFLARMRPDAAAAILAGLDSEKAYSVSVVMAGRNANVPTE